MINIKKYCGILLGLEVVLAVSFLSVEAHAANDPSNQIVRAGDQFFRIEKSPSWVIQRKVASKSDSDSQRPVRYNIIDSQTRLDKSVSNYSFLSAKVLSLAGVEALSNIQIDFSPTYQQLGVHFVRVRRNGKIIDKLPNAEMSLIQQEKDINAFMYNGVYTAFIILKDVRVGDVIEYAYTKTGSNPVFGNTFFHQYAIGWSIPVTDVYVRVLTPAGRKLTVRSVNSNIKPEINAIGNNTNEYAWHLKNTAAIVDELEYPLWYAPYPVIQVSEYQSWNAVKEWSSSIFPTDYKLNSELSAMISDWARNSSTNIDKAGLALNFVQEKIRYFGVEYHTNSHMPSQPNDTFTRRFGDCKDKSVLLSAILNKLGIEAYPALVSATRQEGIKDWLPAPFAFDHVIVKAKIDNSEYWIDPTLSDEPNNLLNLPDLSYGIALVIGNSNTGLEDIPKGKQDNNIRVEENYEVDNKIGSAKLNVELSYSGKLAEWMRRRLSVQPSDEYITSYVNLYERLYGEIKSTSKLDIHDDKSKNVVKVGMNFFVGHYLQDVNEDWSRFEIYPFSIRDYVALPKTMQRKTPLAVLHPLKINHSVKIHFPENSPFSIKTDTVELKDEHIAYQKSVDTSLNEVFARFSYRSIVDTVYPDKSSEHIRLLKKIGDSLSIIGGVRTADYVDKKTKKEKALVNELLEKLP